MHTDELTFEQMCDLLGYTPRRRKLTAYEAAEVLGIKPNTLEIKRHHGTGPKFVKPPGTKFVYYLERDILEWMLAGRRSSTSEPVRATA